MSTSSELYILSRIHTAYQVCAHFFTRVYSDSRLRITEARSSPNRSSTICWTASSTCRCTTSDNSLTILSNLIRTISSMRLSRLSFVSSSDTTSCDNNNACLSRRWPCSSSLADMMTAVDGNAEDEDGVLVKEVDAEVTCTSKSVSWSKAMSIRR